MKRFMCGIALLSLADTARAEAPFPETYHCTILQAFNVSDDGGLVPSEEFWQGSFAKDQLVIDRTDGQAYHPFFGTSNYQERLYLDEGSSEWSFKLLGYSMAISPDSARGRNAVGTFIQVFSYVDGPVKPFIAMESAKLVSGTCE